MNSSRQMLASKLKEDEIELLPIERNTPANASAQIVGASARNIKSPAAKANDPYVTTALYTVDSAIGVSNGRRKILVNKLQEKAYRNAYVRATVTHGLAHQIRVNRELRNLSQHSLATKCGGKTTQVFISRLEDPSYGKFTLNSIFKVAEALDVALVVKLVPYSKFLLETADKSVPALFAKSFEDDNLIAKQAMITFTKTEIASQQYKMIDSTRTLREASAPELHAKPLSDNPYAIIKNLG